MVFSEYVCWLVEINNMEKRWVVFIFGRRREVAQTHRHTCTYGLWLSYRLEGDKCVVGGSTMILGTFRQVWYIRYSRVVDVDIEGGMEDFA